MRSYTYSVIYLGILQRYTELDMTEQCCNYLSYLTHTYKQHILINRYNFACKIGNSWFGNI